RISTFLEPTSLLADLAGHDRHQGTGGPVVLQRCKSVGPELLRGPGSCAFLHATLQRSTVIGTVFLSVPHRRPSTWAASIPGPAMVPSQQEIPHGRGIS